MIISFFDQSVGRYNNDLILTHEEQENDDENHNKVVIQDDDDDYDLNDWIDIPLPDEDQ
jgi:hypothetical protein